MLAQGAEAKVWKKGNTVLKDRFAKSYRHKDLDEQLRTQRTRREAKILEALKDFPVPQLLDTTASTLTLSFIDGRPMKEVLDQRPKIYGKKIGTLLKSIHERGIIHGDVTTSNMIWNNQLYFIDFGLSFFSDKVEDKAVDIHLLRQALESKHPKCWKKCFEAVLEGYNDPSMEKQLKKVEQRGRNKEKLI